MNDISTWRKAWALLERAEKKNALIVLIVIVVTGLLAASMVASIMPFLIVIADPGAIENAPVLAWLYNRLGFEDTVGFLTALGIGSLALILVGSLAQIARTYVINMFSARQMESLSNRLFASYLHQPYAFFLDRHSGDLSTQILTVTHVVVERFFKPAAEIVAASFATLFILVLLFWMSPFVSLISLIVLGGIYGTTYSLTRRRILRLAKEHHNANRERYRISGEALGGFKAIKILNHEEAYVERFKKPTRKVAHAMAVTGVTADIPSYVLQTLAFGGIVALALILLAGSEGNTPADLVRILPTIGLFAFSGQRLLPELQRIYANFTVLHQGAVSVVALYEDLVVGHAPSRPMGAAMSALSLERILTFDDVSFRYPNADRTGLDHISFSLEVNERIGVVGSTGSGKSTLADLLLGLIIPQDGEIRIDGVRLTAENCKAWQPMLAYVPQEIFLIDASVAENIALGVDVEEIDMARVKTACRIAQLDEVLENDLPNGVHSKVGERGVRLSGGQRQRIGLARAVYRDFDLLILDEATSALDSITERKVMEAITALPGRKSAFIIAHRLSTVRTCDRILLLDQGKLIAQGSWEELQRNAPKFREMVATMGAEAST